MMRPELGYLPWGGRRKNDLQNLLRYILRSMAARAEGGDMQMSDMLIEQQPLVA